jgi:thiosulfate/3-mercaptopyruvate sulfurtransferase
VTRYVIIGAGAVGATTAAELQLAGREVLLIARGPHLDLLRQRGLDYIRPDAVRRIELAVAGGPDEVELRPDDVLVLAVKSQDTETTLQRWAWQPVGTSSAAEALPILILQNGLENVRSALRRFATVYDVSILIPASYDTPGEVVSPAAPVIGLIVLGSASGGSDEERTRIAEDLRAAHYSVRIVPDIARWKAAKLLGNLAHNIDALYGRSPLREAAEAALQAEARTVLATAGIPVADMGPGALDASGFTIAPIPGHERGGSSTWQSLARSTSNESDFLNGEIVLLARLNATSAPLNAAIQARIARAVREGIAPGSLGDDDLIATLPSLRESSRA